MLADIGTLLERVLRGLGARSRDPDAAGSRRLARP